MNNTFYSFPLRPEDILHYGVKRKSGRYPWGSGERPYQRSTGSLVEKGIAKKKKLAKDLLGRNISRREAASTTKFNEPITMKKGDKVQHIGVKFNGLREGQLYVTATDYDNKLYEAFLSLNLKSKGFDPSKITLTLSEDLRSPSSKEQRTVFNEYYSKNKKSVDGDLAEWAKTKDKKLEGDIYDNFMNSLESSSGSQRGFYEELKKKGYNAVLDEHDITGSWMQGQAPLIIMDQLATISDYKIDRIDNDRLMGALDEWLKIRR